MFDNIRADIKRKRDFFLGDAGRFRGTLRAILEPGTIAVILYRYGHWAHRLPVPGLRHLLVLSYWLTQPFFVACTQILISPHAQVGKGFVVHNFSNILIADATIGENFIVHQGVTVGHLRHFRGKGRPAKRTPPRIGNNVFLGCGAKVLGDVKIGDNVVVGANSLVITSIRNNTSVVGVPAKAVIRNTSWLQQKIKKSEETD